MFRIEDNTDRRRSRDIPWHRRGVRPTPSSVYVLPDADFPKRIGASRNDDAVHQIITLPTRFVKDESMILDLDGSVHNRLTVITSTGMETFIVNEE